MTINWILHGKITKNTKNFKGGRGSAFTTAKDSSAKKTTVTVNLWSRLL